MIKKGNQIIANVIYDNKLPFIDGSTVTTPSALAAEVKSLHESENMLTEKSLN